MGRLRLSWAASGGEVESRAVRVRHESGIEVLEIKAEEGEATWEELSEEQWMERSEKLKLGNEVVRPPFSP